MNGLQKYPPLSSEQVALSNWETGMAEGRNPAPNRPGECAAFQRMAATEVLGIDRAWKPGPDAIGVFYLMQARGKVLPAGTRAEVGDMMVWIEGHGPDGHIAMRVIGNRAANNSTWNFNRTGNPNGFRNLSDLDPNYRVIRLWEP